MAKAIKSPYKRKSRNDEKSASLYARSLLEASLDPFVTISAEGKITDVNKATELVTGCLREQLIGSDFSDYFTEPEKARAGYKKVFANGFVKDYPLAIRNKSGKITNVLYNASVYRDETGTIQGVFAAARDVTAINEAQEALHKAQETLRLNTEQRWATTLASIGDAVIATDKSGKVTFMNGVAEKMTGWTLVESLQKPVKKVFNIVNEQTRLEVESPITKVLKEGMVVGLANHTILIRKDGSEVPIDDSGAPIKDKEERVTGVVLVFRDISERKKTEKELQNLAKFPGENPYAVLRINHEGTIVYANKESQKLPKPIDMKVGNIVKPHWLNYVKHALSSNCRLDFEEHFGDRWFEFKVAPIVSENYVNIYGVEITERKKAEEALKSSEVKFRTVANFTYDWEYWVGPDGNIIYMSPSCKKITGYEAEEFVKNPKLLTEIVYPEDQKIFGAHFELNSLDKEHQIDFRILTRSKEIRWIAHVCQPVFDNDGKWLGRRVSNRDINDRKQMQEKLEDYNRNLEKLVDERTKNLTTLSLYARSLIEASLDPLVTISKQGKITDVNKATEQVTGCTREELIGSDFSDYFTEPKQAREGYQKVFTEGLVKDYPLAIKHKYGTITDVLYNASVYLNEKGEIVGVFAAARDVTERKKAEENVLAASLYSRSLLEASLDPLVTISAEGKITDVNKATEEVTGFFEKKADWQ